MRVPNLVQRKGLTPEVQPFQKFSWMRISLPSSLRRCFLLQLELPQQLALPRLALLQQQALLQQRLFGRCFFSSGLSGRSLFGWRFLSWRFFSSGFGSRSFFSRCFFSRCFFSSWCLFSRCFLSSRCLFSSSLSSRCFLSSGLSSRCFFAGFSSGFGGGFSSSSGFRFSSSVLCSLVRSFTSRVHFLFSLEACSLLFVAGACQRIDLRLNLGVLVSHPLFEALLCFFFGECAFLHTVQEVVVVDDAFVLHQRANGIGHLRTDLQPVQRTVVLDFDGCRVGVGVVGADLFDESAITWSASVSCYYVVEWFAFFTVALESQSSCHERNVLEGS